MRPGGVMRCRMRSQVHCLVIDIGCRIDVASHAGRLLPAAPSLDLDSAFQRGIISPGQPALDGPATHSPSHPCGAGAGEPSLPLPVGVAPPSQPPPGGWWASEPLAVYPTPGAVVGVVACRCAGPVGVGPRATLARATDNETHGVAIPARSGAHPLSPPHRSTGPRGTDTHLTGREGHRTAGRGLWRAPDQGPSPQTPVEAPLRPSALHDG